MERFSSSFDQFWHRANKGSKSKMDLDPLLHGNIEYPNADDKHNCEAKTS